jgi:hypothetical protein
MVTVKSAGREHRYHGERMTRCDQNIGVARTPAAWRADNTRRPERQQGEHTAGMASRWRAVTKKSAGRARHRHGKWMTHSDQKVSGARISPSPRVDDTQ